MAASPSQIDRSLEKGDRKLPIKDDNIRDVEDSELEDEDVEEEEEEEEERNSEESEGDESEGDDLLLLSQEYPPHSLRMAMMPDCLSLLCKTTNGLGHAFVKFDAVGFELTNVSLLSSYIHIRYVDISHNKLRDISPLKNMIHLIMLKAQFNLLSNVQMIPLDFLQKIDFSNNFLNSPEGLNHPLLSYMNVSNNLLRSMVGSKLFYLKHLIRLEANDNKINTLLGMESQSLKEIHLANNRLKNLEEVESITSIEHLNLTHNRLRTLSGLTGDLKDLSSLDLRNNKLKSISKIQDLEKLPRLSTLILTGNPITEIENYRLEVLMVSQTLRKLDEEDVTDAERQEAEELKAERREERKVQENVTRDRPEESEEEEEEEEEEIEEEEEEDEEKEEADDEDDAA